MNRIFAIAASLLSLTALGAEPKAAPAADKAAACTCDKNAKCDGNCCEACKGSKDAKDGKACTCKTGGCKSCPVCKH